MMVKWCFVGLCSSVFLTQGVHASLESLPDADRSSAARPVASATPAARPPVSTPYATIDPGSSLEHAIASALVEISGSTPPQGRPAAAQPTEREEEKRLPQAPEDLPPRASKRAKGESSLWNLIALVEDYKVPPEGVSTQYIDDFKRKVLKEIESGLLITGEQVQKALEENYKKYARLYQKKREKEKELPPTYPGATPEQEQLITYVKGYMPHHLKNLRGILSLKKFVIRRIMKNQASTLESVKRELETEEKDLLKKLQQRPSKQTPPTDDI